MCKSDTKEICWILESVEGLNFRSRNFFFRHFLASVGSFGLDHLKVKIAKHAVATELKAIYLENGPPFWYCKVTKVLNLKQPWKDLVVNCE